MNLQGPRTMSPSKPVDMLLRFGCPLCATVLEIPRARTGQEGPCPICGATIIAPSVVVVSPDPKRVISHEAVVELPKPKAEAASSAVPSVYTTRLCDLPPRPVFHARTLNPVTEGGELAEVPDVNRRRRHTSRRHSFLGVLRKDMWIVVILLIVVGVAAAFTIYGSEMFGGFQTEPLPLNR